MAVKQGKTRVRRQDGKRKSRFVFRERSPDSVKQRGERKGGTFDSIFKGNVDVYRPKEGDNQIRFLPPTWENPEHYAYQVFVHRNVGPDNSTYLCLQKMKDKPCPICQAVKEAKDAGEEDEAKELRVSETQVAWIIDRNGDESTPMLYQMSWSMDRDIAALCHNKRTGKVLILDHPDQGYDVTLKRQGTGLKTKYFGTAVDREATPINDDEETQEKILDYIEQNPIPSLLNFYDAKYLERLLSGQQEERDDDLDEDGDEEERQAAGGRGKSRKPSRRPRDEEEEEDDPEEESEEEDDPDEEEEDERPKRRGGKTRKPSRRDREEEEEDPDEEEDDPDEESEEEDDPDEEEDDPDEESEEEDERPKRRGGKPRKPSRRPRDEEEEEDDPEEESEEEDDPEEESEEEDDPDEESEEDPDEEEEERPRRGRRPTVREKPARSAKKPTSKNRPRR